MHLVEYRKTSIYFFRRKFSLNFSTSHRVHNLASRSKRYTIFAVSALIGAENKEAILKNTLASRATGKNKYIEFAFDDVFENDLYSRLLNVAKNVRFLEKYVLFNDS